MVVEGDIFCLRYFCGITLFLECLKFCRNKDVIKDLGRSFCSTTCVYMQTFDIVHKVLCCVIPVTCSLTVTL